MIHSLRFGVLVANASSAKTAHRIAATGTFHFTQSRQVSLEDVHLLHQGDESGLCGLSHLLINSFVLEEKRDASQRALERFTEAEFIRPSVDRFMPHHSSHSSSHSDTRFQNRLNCCRGKKRSFTDQEQLDWDLRRASLTLPLSSVCLPRYHGDDKEVRKAIQNRGNTRTSE